MLSNDSCSSKANLVFQCVDVGLVVVESLNSATALNPEFSISVSPVKSVTLMMLCNNSLWIATGLFKSLIVVAVVCSVKLGVVISLPKYTFSIPALNSCDAIGSLAKSLAAVIVKNILFKIILKLA